MSSLTALLLATPIFGFALNPPAVDAPTQAMIASLPPLQLSVSGELDTSADADLDSGSTAAEAPPSAGPAASIAPPKKDYATLMTERAEIAKVHKAFGIATWAAMTVAVALGTIQYYNLYGFGAGRDDNPCVEGRAVFGQGQCHGRPWPHTLSTGLTTLLYGATMGLYIAMPGPEGLDKGNSTYAKKLRMHKLLRWVHFGGMVAQVLLGVVAANGKRFGLDRANDYGALQAIATTHLALGFITYGALTWSGAIMMF